MTRAWRHGTLERGGRVRTEYLLHPGGKSSTDICFGNNTIVYTVAWGVWLMNEVTVIKINIFKSDYSLEQISMITILKIVWLSHINYLHEAYIYWDEIPRKGLYKEQLSNKLNYCVLCKSFIPVESNGLCPRIRHFRAASFRIQGHRGGTMCKQWRSADGICKTQHSVIGEKNTIPQIGFIVCVWCATNFVDCHN